MGDEVAVATGLSRLRSSLLPSEWVEAVWTNNFIDTADSCPVEELAQEDAITGLNQLIVGLAHWKSRSDEFWVYLAEQNISVRALIPLLHYFMDSTGDKPEASVLAATCYCALLNVPGSGSHSAFNPMVYRTATKILDQWVTAADGQVSSPTKSSGSKRMATSPAHGESGKRRGGTASEVIEDSDGAASLGSLPSHFMIGLFREYVQTLVQVSGEGGSDTADEIVQMLIRATRMSWSSAPTHSLVKQLDAALGAGTTPTPIALGYTGLRMLFSGGPEVQVVVCRGLLKSVTMRHRATTTTIPKAVTVIRTTAVAFVATILVPESADLAPIRLLVQHACTKVPDKADYRSAVAVSAARIILAISAKDVEAGAQLLAWTAKLSRNGKVGYRSFAIELISALLQSSVGRVTPLSHIAEFTDILVSRASDRSAVVRAKALACIATTVTFAGENDADGVLAKELTTRYTSATVLEAVSDHTTDSFSDIITRRTRDDKSNVRKAAIQVVEVFATATAAMPAPAQVKALQTACNDISVNVRKQALASFTLILKANPTSAELRGSWLDAVMPLVIDAEETVRNKCSQLLKTFLLNPIVNPSDAEESELGWLLLELMDGKQDLRRYLQRLCANWDRDEALPRVLFERLVDHVCDPTTTGGWSLFNEIAARQPQLVDATKVEAAWRSCAPDNLETTTHLLAVVGNAVEQFPAAVLAEIAEELRARLVQFAVPVCAVSGMLHCLERISTVDETGQNVSEFFANLMQVAERKLASVSLSGESDAIYDEISLARQVFTFGETALLCPTTVNKRHVLIIQALVAPVIPTRDAEIARDAHPPAVRAHAFLCIGKLCLQDEELAKQTIAAMAHELEVCTDPAVRNNIVIVITDLCVRHPNAIQQYLPNIALCLKDETALVRRQTITLLTRLLKEDFIKLRFGLVFRLIMTVVDPDESVRDLAKFCVVNILKVKDESIFYANFIECVYHFNTVTDHQIYNRFPQRDKEVELFTLAGAANKTARETLYALMLQHCSEVERIQLTQKLCQDVLMAVADGSLPFTAGVQIVLKDTLAILTSPDIKVQTSKAVDNDEDDARLAAASKAKDALVSKILRKNVVENIVPIVIGLKQFLEFQRSPLMRDLMIYLRELMKDYKSEIEDVMAADRQLADEIEFDMRKFDEEQKRTAEIAAAAAAAAAAPASPARSAVPGSACKSASKSQRRRRSSLHNATPQQGTSPLLSPSLFASFGAPGSPAFAAPKLRKSQLSSSTSASALAQMRTPSGAVGTPLASVPGSATQDPLLDTPAPVDSMAWVRTPKSKQRSLGAPASRNGKANDVIRLRTPLATHVESASKFRVDPPKFPSVVQEKRDRDDGPALDEIGEGADENAVDICNIVEPSPPPPKKQQLSRAELRKRKVAASKLSVTLTEKRIELEGHIECENFFDAERVKGEIDTLVARKAELTV